MKLTVPIVINFDREQLEEIVQKRINELIEEGYIWREEDEETEVNQAES